jgi:septum formation protein
MRILLASKSPRRKQLLEQLGYQIELVHQDIEEIFPENLPIPQVPVYLAELKARAVKQALQNDDDIIIASDTIVAMNGEIYHKPTDFADGQRILRALQGKTHQVITGVFFLTTEIYSQLTDVAHVTFAPMSDTEIDFYLHKYKPYDKAGAYAIQEWVGLAKIQKIEGSYATVMGLPTHLVYDFIENRLPKIGQSGDD